MTTIVIVIICWCGSKLFSFVPQSVKLHLFSGTNFIYSIEIDKFLAGWFHDQGYDVMCSFWSFDDVNFGIIIIAVQHVLVAHRDY